MNDPEQISPLNVDDKLASTAEKTSQSVSKGSLIATILAGVIASACCIGPFVLLTLGVSGSWISNFSALEPLRPVFIGITVIFLGITYRKLYLLPQSCNVDSPCTSPSYLHKQRIIFWLVTIAVVAIVTFPWYGPLLLDD